MAKHCSLLKLIIVALNVAVVCYLVPRLKQRAANSTDLRLALAESSVTAKRFDCAFG